MFVLYFESCVYLINALTIATYKCELEKKRSKSQCDLFFFLLFLSIRFPNDFLLRFVLLQHRKAIYPLSLKSARVLVFAVLFIMFCMCVACGFNSNFQIDSKWIISFNFVQLTENKAINSRNTGLVTLGTKNSSPIDNRWSDTH